MALLPTPRGRDGKGVCCGDLKGEVRGMNLEDAILHLLRNEQTPAGYGDLPKKEN